MDDLKKLRKKLQKTRSKMINYPGVHQLVGGLKEGKGYTKPVYAETLLSQIFRQIPDALDKRTRKKGDKILKKIKDIKEGPGKAMADLEYQLDLANPRNETLPAVPYKGQFGTDYKTGEFYEKQGTLPAIRRYNKVTKKNEGGFVKGFGIAINKRKIKVY